MYGHIDPGPEPLLENVYQDSDIEMASNDIEAEATDAHDMSYDPISNHEADRLIIAIDFGTTFSSVAYIKLQKGWAPDEVGLHQIKCVSGYPGWERPKGLPDLRQDVPTELWYDEGQAAFWNAQQCLSAQDDEDSQSDVDSPIAEDDVFGYQLSRSHFDNGDESDQLASHQPSPESTSSATQYWGYQIQQELSINDIPRDVARPLTKMKLNLVSGKETDDIRTELKMSLKTLRKKKIIRRDTDIYRHFLVQLLKHTKSQLDSDELHRDTIVEFVLCVPAKWPLSACRTMQAALEEAVEDTQLCFSSNTKNAVCNLFMISEPEAAAECILAEARSELFRNETVVVLDAGGGTVDAVTYQCVNDDPVRLESEIVAPDSDLCGASFINERFGDKLSQKLAKETYLWDTPGNPKTLKSIVEVLTDKFENDQKRTIDITMRQESGYRFRVEDLLETRKGFFPNVLILDYNTMAKIYLPSLQGAKNVLEKQLNKAEEENQCVEKVILTGGFGQSPSLRSYLQLYLQGRVNVNGRKIELIIPQNSATAVARGAVLRALNKRFGPSRILQCSYGFILSEVYEPEQLEAHRTTKCRINKNDGERYVDETIRWVLQAGERVENMKVITYNVKHTFSEKCRDFVCKEQLWMSDKSHENHYRKTNAKNKDAVMVGYLVSDVTELKEKGLMKLQQPTEFSTYAGSARQFWEIWYEISLIVEGRSIRFAAKHPIQEHLRPGEEQRSLSTMLVGIASAFKPGTA